MPGNTSFVIFVSMKLKMTLMNQFINFDYLILELYLDPYGVNESKSSGRW